MKQFLGALVLVTLLVGTASAELIQNGTFDAGYTIQKGSGLGVLAIESSQGPELYFQWGTFSSLQNSVLFREGSYRRRGTTRYGVFYDSHDWATPYSVTPDGPVTNSGNQFVQLRAGGNLNQESSVYQQVALAAGVSYTLKFSYSNVLTSQPQGNLFDNATLKVLYGAGADSSEWVQLAAWSGVDLKGQGWIAGRGFSWVDLAAVFTLDEEHAADVSDLIFVLTAGSGEGDDAYIDMVYLDNVSLDETPPIPEPSTWVAILGMGTVGLGLGRRLRRKARSCC